MFWLTNKLIYPSNFGSYGYGKLGDGHPESEYPDW